MKLAIVCNSCGVRYELDITAEQQLAWISGALVQQAFPNLSASKRELLISGTCGKCYDKIWKETKDD